MGLLFGVKIFFFSPACQDICIFFKFLIRPNRQIPNMIEPIVDCKTVGFFLKISKEIGKA